MKGGHRQGRTQGSAHGDSGQGGMATAGLAVAAWADAEAEAVVGMAEHQLALLTTVKCPV